MASPIRDIKGLVALVTGGASGLGEGVVRRLVRNEVYVVIGDLPSSKGDKLAEELGEKCIFVPLDVTKEADVQEALNVTKAKFHKLDIVVNCAGIFVGSLIYDFEKNVSHSLHDFQKIMNVNAIGTLNVIRLAVGLMGKNQPDKDGQRGVIINTSSLSGEEGTQTTVSYSASKGAVNGMTLPLARDLGSQGIRCCTIAPGYFNTPLLQSFPAEVLEAWGREVPFPGRLGEPDEFAHLVQTIIENSMLNGCVIRLDGAVRLRMSDFCEK